MGSDTTPWVPKETELVHIHQSLDIRYRFLGRFEDYAIVEQMTGFSYTHGPALLDAASLRIAPKILRDDVTEQCEWTGYGFDHSPSGKRVGPKDNFVVMLKDGAWRIYRESLEQPNVQ